MRDAGFRVNEYFIYARGLEEARSAVEARLAEYRRVSREWHDFLVSVPTRRPRGGCCLLY